MRVAVVTSAGDPQDKANADAAAGPLLFADALGATQADIVPASPNALESTTVTVTLAALGTSLAANNVISVVFPAGTTFGVAPSAPYHDLSAAVCCSPVPWQIYSQSLL